MKNGVSQFTNEYKNNFCILNRPAFIILLHNRLFEYSFDKCIVCIPYVIYIYIS